MTWNQNTQLAGLLGKTWTGGGSSGGGGGAVTGLLGNTAGWGKAGGGAAGVGPAVTSPAVSAAPGFRPYQPMAPGLTYEQQLAIIQGFARNAGLLGTGGASSDPPPRRSEPIPLPAPQTPTPGGTGGSFAPNGAVNLNHWRSRNPNATQAQHQQALSYWFPGGHD